ncbi:hypothetical protein BOX15_Mlig003088g14 [Macrostomum lignano]|nr:hypothetical protein BOX15_Mlig003088g14 [Macrostomum lignano]
MVLVHFEPVYYEFYQSDLSGESCSAVCLAYYSSSCATDSSASSELAVDDSATFAGDNNWLLRQLCP